MALMADAIPGDLIELVTLAREIAAREGIPYRRSAQRMRNWIERGKIQAFSRRSGGHLLVSRAEVDYLLQIVPRAHDATE
jgi:hypothetical protein